MKKNLFNAFVFGLLLVGSGTFVSCDDNDDDIKRNTELINNLTSEVTSLQTALEECRTDCESAISSINTTLSAEIAAAKAELEQAISQKADASTVSALEANIASLETSLNTQVIALTARLDALDTAIAGLESDKLSVATYEAALAEYLSWQSSVNNKIQTLEDGQLTVSDAISKLSYTTDSIKFVLDTNSSNIAANTDAINSNAASIASNTAAITAAQVAIAELQTQLAALQLYKEQVLDVSVPARVDSLATVTQSIETLLATLSEQVSSNSAAIESNSTAIENNSAAIENNSTAIENNSTAISNNSMRIDTLSSYLNNNFVTISEFDSKIATLTLLVKRQLTSLVLKPSYYYGGIEAVEVPTLRDFPTITLADGELTASETWTRNAGTVTISNGGVAVYHVNPTTADLSGYAIDFYGNNPVTRAGIEFVSPKQSTYEDLVAANENAFVAGLISIPFTVDYTVYDQVTKDGQTPMIALQMSKTDEDGQRTVSSDYAMLNVTQYTALYLADKTFADCETQTLTDMEKRHLYGEEASQTVNDLTVADSYITHIVAYDGSLDLNEIIETHYNYKNTLSDEEAELTMDQSAFDALGFSYQFDLVSYTLPGRNKSEDQYVTLTDGVIQAIADDNESARGHQPIIRVLLKDADGNILKVGYIKVQIEGLAYAVTTQEYTETNAIDCENGATFNTVTVATAEKALYEDSRIDMTAEQFAATYYYEQEENNLVQYTLASSAMQKAESPLGVVTVAQNESSENVYAWTFTYDELKTLTYDENGYSTDDVVTYIHYTNGGNLHAYVQLVIPAGQIVAPALELSTDSKVLSRWYEENGGQDASDDQLTEVHINPEVYGQSGADDEIYTDLDNNFLGQEPAYTFKNDLYSADDITGYYYEFLMPGDSWTVTGFSGSTYKLEVINDGTQIQATQLTDANDYKVEGTEIIADLSGDYNSVFTYNTKDQGQALMSYDILNYAGHTELGEGETFKVYIGINALVDCDTIAAGQMTARVLRPVDFVVTTVQKSDEDAVDYGFTIPISDLFTTPTDWRDQWISEYWSYYNISLSTDISKAYTDASKGVNDRTAYDPTSDGYIGYVESLAKVETAGIQLTWDATAGTLTYTNNNQTIGDFHVYVPVIVNYDWGYNMLVGYARLDIGKTVNNVRGN